MTVKEAKQYYPDKKIYCDWGKVPENYATVTSLKKMGIKVEDCEWVAVFASRISKSAYYYLYKWKDDPPKPPEAEFIPPEEGEIPHIHDNLGKGEQIKLF
jgi:hypothetical protein